MVCYVDAACAWFVVALAPQCFMLASSIALPSPSKQILAVYYLVLCNYFFSSFFTEILLGVTTIVAECIGFLTVSSFESVEEG